MEEKTDEEILQFYLDNKEQGTDLYWKWVKEKKLLTHPRFQEARILVRLLKNDIYKQLRKPHRREAV